MSEYQIEQLAQEISNAFTIGINIYFLALSIPLIILQISALFKINKILKDYIHKNRDCL